jgi:indolepyruvate decarboxylase
VFEKFTIAGTELNDPLTAFAEIDRVLDACDRYKRPVYIELPRDVVHVVPPIAHGYRGVVHQTDPQATAEAIRETVDKLAVAKKPIIVAGVEIHRFGLQDEVLKLAESAAIPISATMLGKSVVSERHPMFVGLYEGGLGDQAVTEFVEESDLILLLGAFLSDINLGIYTAKLDPSRCVYVTSEAVRVSHHHFHDVGLKEFLVGLNQAQPVTAKRTIPQTLRPAAATQADGAAAGDGPLRTSWMIKRLNRLLDAETIVIADVGDALFAATELTIHEHSEFLSPAYYTSMGFSVPAALGAATAKPDHRVVVLVGDGAFQMTGQELSTLIRNGHHPIVIVLDNHGYGTERYLHAGEWRYNEINPWQYGELLKVYGGGVSHVVRTESEYESALKQAWEDGEQAHLIHAKLMENDASDTLRKLAARMSPTVG